MKKAIWIMMQVLIISVLLTACGGSTPSPDSMSDNDLNNRDGNSATGEVNVNESKSDVSNNIQYTSETLTKDKKIIRNASVDMEADNSLTAYNSVLNQAAKLGGYEFNRDSNTTDRYSVVSAEIKIPAVKLSEFLNYLPECGKIINLKVSADDITDQYTETETRLESLRKNLQKYYEFLEKAQNIDETLKVQNEINRLTGEIEVLQGKINLWSKQVDESTVAISIREKEDPIKVQREIQWNSLSASDMGTLMTNGFVRVLNFIVSAVQWLIIVIITLLPILIIVGIIVFIVLKISRKKKKSTKNEEDASNVS